MIRVLIVDDHDIVREGLKQIVSETTDIVAAGEATSGNEALDQVRSGSWDVVVLDLNLPDRNGIDILAQIRSINPALPVLILSMHPEETYAPRLLKTGAAGYVSKDRAREHLTEAIRKTARGERFITPTLAQRLAIDMVSGAQATHEKLSDREFQILVMIASGKPPREIAAELGVSVKTVATHRSRILEKLGLRNNAAIVQYALENKLLE